MLHSASDAFIHLNYLNGVWRCGVIQFTANVAKAALDEHYACRLFQCVRRLGAIRSPCDQLSRIRQAWPLEFEVNRLGLAFGIDQLRIYPARARVYRDGV